MPSSPEHPETTPRAPRLSADFAEALPHLARPGRGQKPPRPSLAVLNEPLAEGLSFLTGTAELPGQCIVAQGYSGHQFGSFSPVLGDGRALLLGEIRPEDAQGADRPVDLHAKGTGTTDFSRPGSDGLAALGPMLREHLVGEALHALGIPSTRGLAVVRTGGSVHRERVLPGAVLVRTAPSHVRVGSFQLAALLQDDRRTLRDLTDFAIGRHCPENFEAENPALALYAHGVRQQADLVARWMLAGFVHGVMNTDNAAVGGHGMDYGPCAFLDAYDPDAVFSSIDRQGRYRFRNQPGIAEWNLARWGEAMLPLFSEDPQEAADRAGAVLEGFAPAYDAARTRGLAAKLGISERELGRTDTRDQDSLGERLLGLMARASADLTTTFRELADVARGRPGGSVVRALETLPEFAAWRTEWLALSPDPEAMDRTNPVYIPRNHLVEEALEAAVGGTEDHGPSGTGGSGVGDLGPFHALLERVADPFRAVPGQERYSAPAPSGSGPYVTFCGT